MFNKLKSINKMPKPFEQYTAEKLWNNPHISKKMLKYHLDENIDVSSRNKYFIEKSINWISSKFKINQDAKIIDFGCGPGLYTTKLAELGAKVTGIDFSSHSLNHAKKVCAEKNLSIKYVLKNYLDYDSEEKFDLIIMIMCDFCALSPVQRKKLLSIFKKLLKDDGSILLDVYSLNSFDERREIVSYEYMQMDGFWSENKYYGFINTVKYNEEKVVLDKYTIVEELNTWEVYNWLQYYSIESIKKEFAENGLEIVEYYSDVSGKEYSTQSFEIAVVAKNIP